MAGPGLERRPGVLDLSGARMAVQGFGAVGCAASTALAERGAVIVAVLDSKGAISNAAGLDIAALLAHKKASGSIAGFASGRTLPRDDVIAFECDILVPAAQPDVVTTENAGKVSAQVILDGANIPVAFQAEAELAECGVLFLPDVVGTLPPRQASDQMARERDVDDQAGSSVGSGGRTQDLRLC